MTGATRTLIKPCCVSLSTAVDLTSPLALLCFRPPPAPPLRTDSWIAVDPAGKAWGKGSLIRYLGSHDWGGRGKGEGEGARGFGGGAFWVLSCSQRFVVRRCRRCLAYERPRVTRVRRLPVVWGKGASVVVGRASRYRAS